AAERARVAVNLLVAEAEAVQHFARPRLELVAAEVLVLLLDVAVALERRFVVEVLLELDQLVMQIAEAAAAGDRLIEYRTSTHLVDFLAEDADGQLLRDGDDAVVGRFLADDHPEERRFPGAVRPDQPRFFARIEL